MPKVDHIIVLQHGQVSEAGPYQELLSHNRAFAQFLKTYLIQDDDDDPESEILFVNIVCFVPLELPLLCSTAVVQ